MFYACRKNGRCLLLANVVERFLKKCHKSLSSVSGQISYKIVHHVYVSLQNSFESLGKKMSAYQNAHTIFFTCEKIVQPVKRSW